MKKTLVSIFLFLGFSFPFSAYAQLNTTQGGTGTSSPSGILYGTTGNLHLQTVNVGSGLTFSAGTLSANSSGGGSGNVSTSTGETAGQLAYWTSTNGTPALLGKVATTSLGVTGPITFSGTLFAQIGGTGGNFGCTTASSGVTGCLSGTDWTTFNGKLANVTADAPLSGSGTSGSHLVLSTAGTWSGNAGTATALAANGTNCSAGNYPLGVDASGNAESCTAAAAGTVTAVSVATANGFAGSSGGGATPALTLTTTATGLLWANGTAIAASSTPTAAVFIATSTTVASQFQQATSTQITLGTVWNTGITSALVSVDANHKENAYAGSSGVCTNQFPTSLSALGVLGTCTSVTDAFFSGQLGLSHGGTNASLSGANQVPYINSGNTALTNDTLFSRLATQGSLLLGTTTAQYGLQTLGTSTAPQVLLSDNAAADNMWILRSAGNNLYVATSTAAATSSVSAFRLDSNGLPYFPMLGTSGVVSVGAGGVLSAGTLSIGNGGTNATSCGTTGAVWYYDGTRFVCATNMTYNGATGQLLTFTNASSTNLTTGYLNVSNANATTSVTGNVSIASTSPNTLVVKDGFGTQQVVDSTASSTGNEFQVTATSSGLAMFAINALNGHITASSTGATPGISSCGTGSPVMGASANDVVGSFTTGTSASACTITFASAYSSTPVVVVSDSNTSAVIDVSAISTTAFTISLASALSADTVYYMVVMP